MGERTHEEKDDVSVLKLDFERIRVPGEIGDVGLVPSSVRNLGELSRTAKQAHKPNHFRGDATEANGRRLT